MPAFPQAVSNLRDLVLAVAIAQGAACMLLLAARRDRLVSHRVLMVAGSVLTALVVGLGVAAIAATWTGETYSGEGRVALILSLASVIYLPAALVWFGWKRRGESEAARAAEQRPGREA